MIQSRSDFSGTMSFKINTSVSFPKLIVLLPETNQHPSILLGQSL